MKTTWRDRLISEMEDQGDTDLTPTLAPNLDAFLIEFDAGYGGPNGPEVLAWTETRVYFPVTYDGMEWISSAPRNPQPGGQRHVGSW